MIIIAGVNVDYQSLLNSINNPIISLQHDLKIIYCNAAYAEQVGKNAEELLGRNYLEIFQDKTGSPSHIAYMEVLETSRPGVVEDTIGNQTFIQHVHRTPDGVLSIADNISPIKRWEEAAVALARDHRAVFDEINDAIFIHDVNDGRIVDVNQAACDLFEYTREELLNMTMGELSAQSPPYNRNDFVRWIMKPAILRNPRLEWKGRDRTGRTFWIHVKSKRMTIGSEIRQVAVIQDITRRMHAEKELRDLEDRYQDLFENPEDFIFTHDLAGNFLSVNQAAEKITGYWTENLIKMNIQQLAAGDSLKLLRGFQYQRMKQGVSSHYELEMVTRHEQQVFLDVNIWPVYCDGKPVAVQGIARNVTDRKLKELELQMSFDKLSSFIDLLPDATLAIDLEGKVVVWNQAMEQLTGIPAHDMLGKGNYEYGLAFYNSRRPIMADLVLKPEEVKQYYSIIEVDKYTVISEFDTSNLRGSGHYLWGQANSWYDHEGRLIGAIESLRDITERYKNRQELKESQEKINQAYRYLNKLIDNLNGAVCSFSTSGCIKLANCKFTREVGFSVDELHQMQIADLAVEPYKHIFDDSALDAMLTGEDKSYEIVFNHKDGSQLPVNIMVRPLRDGDKVIGGILWILGSAECEVPSKS